MNSQDYSFNQGVLYRPNIQENLKLDKRYNRRSHEIFQSLTLRKNKQQKSQNINQSNQNSLFQFLQSSKKGSQKFQLPNIYLHSKLKCKPIIPIAERDQLLKLISASLNFVNKKMSVLDTSILTLLNQQTKAIPYQGQVYEKQIKIINRIFYGCGINLKVKDILVLEAEQSKAKFSIFTNHPKHPQSICCKSQVVIKHMDFMSSKNFNFFQQKGACQRLKSLILIVCLKCGSDVIKIRPESSSQRESVELSEFQEQKRLINFSKIISSGRFKNGLIHNESVKLMKISNVMAPSRSKSGESGKIQLVPNSDPLTNYRCKKSDRQKLVKSERTTIDVLQRLKQSQIRDQSLSTKRKNNILSLLTKHQQQ